MRISDQLLSGPARGLRMLPWAACCITALWANPLLATDCKAIANGGVLSTQEQVDAFQATYGPCDAVVADLGIEGFDITDLTPLASLNRIGGTLSVFNSKLFALVGLEGLTSVGGLLIQETVFLTSLGGLHNLSSVGGISIIGNALLPDLDGLPVALAAVNYLQIFGNPQMTSLDGMPAIAALTGIVQIGENDLLASISALASSGIPAGDSPEVDIAVFGNPSLTSLHGLPVTGKLWSLGIAENTVLTSLGGLENLVEIWEDLSIHDNPALSDCLALTTVLDDVDDGAAGPSLGGPPDPPDSPGLAGIWISANLSGCNSIEEALGAEPEDTVLANGFEGA